jgi:hypothetical protein
VAQPVIPVVIPVAPPAPTPPRVSSRRAAAIHVSPQLASLLGSPEALRTAIILREIFDPPLCKR